MRVVFGPFQLDLDGCELTRDGRPVALERRPTELLCLLAARPGELVMRHELAQRIWGGAAGIDADMGINTAIGKIRRALDDSPSSPRHVETVQGRGYRFIAELRTPDVPATIAVLPFDNLTGSPALDYVADGFAEETMAALGQVAPDRLRVIGRRSVVALGRDMPAPEEVGRRLGATHLLESAVRAEGTWLRVTTRLIEAAGQQQIWSAAFDGQAGRLLAFQQEVSQAVAGQVRQHFQLAPRHRSPRHTGSEAAYDLYLRGRHCWNANQSRATQEAVGYFERATTLDPGYALAWSGLADTHSASPINSDVPAASIWRQARMAAERAVAAGPELAEAVASMGFVRFWLDWDWPAALADFRRAATLDPNYAFAYRMIGIAASHLGLHAPAEAAMRRSVELDPLFPMHHALSSMVAFQAGRFEAAADFARAAIGLDGRFWIGHWQLAQAAEQLGDPEQALAALAAASITCGDSSKPAALRGYVLARMGRTEEARAELGMLDQAACSRFVPPYGRALIHAGLNEADQAFLALNQAVDARDVNLAFLPLDPKWRDFRADPRFGAVLTRCGFFAATHRPD